jgi:hypothetical protein
MTKIENSKRFGHCSSELEILLSVKCFGHLRFEFWICLGFGA